jgi:serine/threonine protein kinase
MLFTALAQIHKIGVIHCDLKPENIMIKSYQPFEVKIVDFGNACFPQDHMGNYIQSRSYRAPEAIFGLQNTYKIDIWSIGCILA